MDIEKKATYTDYIVSFLKYIVRTKYQMILMSLFVVFLITVFTFVFMKETVFEARPLLKPILPQELKGFASGSTQVEVGLHINDFPEFNMRSNTFIFDANIWFLFDQSAISLETVDRFSFARGNILQKSAPETKLIGGNYFAQYSIRVEFKAELNQKYFPFDDHRLYIEMENKSVTPEEMVFKAPLSAFLLSKSVLVIGWKPVDRFVETGYMTFVLDKFDPNKNVSYPKIVFAVDFSRTGIQDIFLVFLPLFLMVFISLFSFSFDPPDMSKSIFSLALTSITGLMGYRFVLQSLTPQVGYFVLSDCFFLLFLAVIFLIFCTCLVIVHRSEMTDKLIVLRGLVFILSYVLLIGFTCYFLFFWPYI